MNKYLINIVGPTAIGKTAMAIKLARYFKTEIISADSRQFYKEMKLGTAVPEKTELEAVPHHFIQHISIEDEYNVGDFERDALSRLKKLFKDKQVVVMLGGSGLYIKSVLEGLDNFPEVNPEIRQKLNAELEEKGIDSLQKKLYVLDPKYYKVADVQNPHRLIRALEICIGTGAPFSSFLNKPKPKRDFQSISIGLEAERELIYDHINKRVDKMMAAGLLAEARQLLPKKHLNALQTVGYKELFQHLEGKIDLETAVAEIKKNTRRFAKRQLTWFRKDASIKWFNRAVPSENVIDYLETKINSEK